MLNNITFPLLLIFSLICAVHGGSADGHDYCEKRGSTSTKTRVVGGNEARPGTQQINFTNCLTKLAILPDYKRPGMICLALSALHKVRKLDFQSEFSMSKIIQIFLIFFFIEE